MQIQTREAGPAATRDERTDLNPVTLNHQRQMRYAAAQPWLARIRADRTHGGKHDQVGQR
jgi:hypothetical protein